VEHDGFYHARSTCELVRSRSGFRKRLPCLICVGPLYLEPPAGTEAAREAGTSLASDDNAPPLLLPDLAHAPRTVYSTPTGEVYHVDGACRGIGTGDVMPKKFRVARVARDTPARLWR
jgi:hypothetical protein